MKKWISVFVCLLLCGLMAGAAADADVTAQGMATITAEPDMLVINANATLVRETVGEAQRDAADVMNSVIEQLSALGIAQEDIVTSYYSVYPSMDYGAEPARLVGYTIDHSFNVTCRDVTKLDAAIGVLTDCSIEHIYGVDFESSRRDELYRQALALAVADAREKAEVLAAASGMKLGAAEEVAELTSYDTYGAASRSMAFAEKDAAGTGIRSGDISVSAAVSVKFEAK